MQREKKCKEIRKKTRSKGTVRGGRKRKEEEEEKEVEVKVKGKKNQSAIKKKKKKKERCLKKENR